MRTARLLCICSAGYLLSGLGLAQSAATNFGLVNVAASETAAVTVSIPSAATLGSITVLTQGAAGLDFTNAGGGTCAAEAAYAANSSCTVEVTFKPRYPGMRYGAVVLTDTTANRMAAAYVYGSGQGPQTSFLPGIQSTLTFNSQTFPEHIAVDGSGNLYVINSLSNINSLVKETLSGTGYTQSPLGSGLASPVGIAVDGAGDLYIADTYEFRIVKETLSGGSYVQSTAVNIPPATYPSEPYGIAVDGSGNLYITDASNKRALKETLSAGTYTQSIVPAVGLNAAYGIAVDGAGNVYIADTFNNRVVEETLSGASYNQTTVASGLSYPYGVAVDGSGNLYIADSMDSQVLRLTTGGTSVIQSTVGSGLAYPYGVAVDGTGNVYIADSGNQRTLKEDFTAVPTLSFAATKEGATSTDSPQTVTLCNLGNVALQFLAVTYPTDFPEEPSGTGDCKSGTSLTTGETCTLTMNFSPVAAGTSGGSILLSESVTVATDMPNAATTGQTIPVTGTEILSPPVAATPVLPLNGGTYTAGQSITLTDATKGAVIYYTTNGATPTASSTKYPGAIMVSQTTTIQAIAVASGYANSAVASATYTIMLPAATPVLSPNSGIYAAGQSIALTDATKGAVIYYTTNGATPTASSTKYTGAIVVSQTTTIQAIAVASGYSNSAVASATYTFMLPAATPVLSPNGGTYTAGQSIALTDATKGAVIYYTTNGAIPTASSTKYSAAIKVSATETIQAIAVASGYANSAAASATYTIK
jgi:sugar lactone lactonase YvrE